MPDDSSTSSSANPFLNPEDTLTGDAPEISPVDHNETAPSKEGASDTAIHDSEAITESSTEAWSGLDLPLVLLIGDSISIGYTQPVRQLLEGVAIVERVPVNCQHTGYGFAAIESWLGDAPWSVIHFNFGLHDIAHRTPRADAPMAMDLDNGIRQTPVEQYGMLLRGIVYRLKQTNAKLIWASTTPVPEGATGRRAGDEVEINGIAEEIMNQHQITVNDLHGFATPKLESIQLASDVHFTGEGYELLGGEVARHIRDALQG